MGEPPPPTLKVTANLDAGWRNAMTLAITRRPASREKARVAAAAVWAGMPGGRDAFVETSEELSGDLTGGGMAFLRLAVRGSDEHAVGRAFSGAVVETSLASYPGTFFTSAPGRAQAAARYWPTTIAAGEVPLRILCEGEVVAATPRHEHAASDVLAAVVPTAAMRETDATPTPTAPTPTATPGDAWITVPLWVLVGGRSGDKGGDANVGLWADAEAVARWLCESFDVAAFKEALPEAAPFEVRRYPLPNLRAVNFVVHGILGWGVASNLRLDAQAKGLAELLRSRTVVVPSDLVAHGKPAERYGETRPEVNGRRAPE